MPLRFNDRRVGRLFVQISNNSVYNTYMKIRTVISRRDNGCRRNDCVASQSHTNADARINWPFEYVRRIPHTVALDNSFLNCHEQSLTMFNLNVDYFFCPKSQLCDYFFSSSDDRLISTLISLWNTISAINFKIEFRLHWLMATDNETLVIFFFSIIILLEHTLALAHSHRCWKNTII